MDKYEYRLKLDEIKETISNGEYAEAARLADSVNWNKVKNANTLCLIGSVYKKVSRTEDAREIYKLAYKRSPGSKNALYYLCELSIKLGEALASENYYKEFLQVAPKDKMRFILGYKIACLLDKPIEERIGYLEDLKREEFMEEWAYELAYLYYQGDYAERCIKACDELAVWFGDGEYVRKALELKTHFQPLTAAQQAQYDRITHTAGTAGREEIRIERAAHEELAKEVRKETQRLEDETRFAPEPAGAYVSEETPESFTDAMPDSISKVKDLPKEDAEAPVKEVEFREVPYYPSFLSRPEAKESVPEETVSGESVPEEAALEELVPEAAADEEPVLKEVVLKESILKESVTEEPVSEEAVSEEAVSEEPVTGEVALKEAESEAFVQEALKIRTALGEVQAQAAALSESAVSEEDAALCAALADEVQKLAEELDGALIRLQTAEPEEAATVREPAAIEEPEDTIEPAEAKEPAAIEKAAAAEEAAAIEETAEAEEAAAIEEPAEAEEPAASAESEEITESEEIAESEETASPEAAEEAAELAEIEETAESEVIEETAEPEVIEEAAEPEVIEEPAAVAESAEPAEAKKQIEPEAEAEPGAAEEPEESAEPQAAKEPAEPEKPAAFRVERMEAPHGAGGPVGADLSDFGDLYEGEDPSHGDAIRRAHKESLLERADGPDIDEAPGFPKAEEPAVKPAERPLEELSEDSDSIEEEMFDDEEEEEPEESFDEPAADNLLSETQRAYFSYFLPVPGMEAQIYDAVEGICAQTRGARDSAVGNAVIIGEEGSGKTVLATSLIKVIQEKFDKHGSKIGKISAASLNRRDFAGLLPKIAGGYLIVENAGELTRETAIRMSQIMEQNTEGLLIILEDNAIGIRKAMDLDYGFAKKFTHKIRIPIFTIDELVNFGKTYAREKNCEIDAMGILALTTRINNIQKLDHVTALTEVKQIMDDAIDSARNGSGRKLFRARRGDAGEALVLQESDFDV